MLARRNSTWVVWACFLVSLILVVVPLPDTVDWFRPIFPLLVVIYWAVALPTRYGVWSGWLLGLLVDVLRAEPFGAHALVFAVAGFAASRLSPRMKVYPMLQQVVVVGVLSGACVMLLRMVGNMTGTTTANLLPTLLPVVTTAMLWPWALGVQERLRRTFNVS